MIMGDYCIRVSADDIVVDLRAREWCKLPYPGHPHGCPNYGVSQNCPPKCPLITEYIDIEQGGYLHTVEFDIAEHMRKMKDAHPHWTERQCRNPLYWQGSVRKRLRESVESRMTLEGEVYTLIPEAMGVHVFRTARGMGIPIKKYPERVVYKIALSGWRAKG